MAQHILLKKEDEPKIFEKVEEIKRRVVALHNYINDFADFRIKVPGKYFTCKKMPKDFSDDENTVVYMVGKFSLASITDEDISLHKNIFLECHFKINEFNVTVEKIFWVV